MGNKIYSELFIFFTEKYPNFFKDAKQGEDFSTINILDSISIMDLTMFIEKKYSISIDDSDVSFANFSSINSIVNFIENKTKN